MDQYNPNCPNCGIELDFIEHFDSYDSGDIIVCMARGTCPHCNKNYRWEDVYKLSNFQWVEEEED